MERGRGRGMGNLRLRFLGVDGLYGSLKRVEHQSHPVDLGALIRVDV